MVGLTPFFRCGNFFYEQWINNCNSKVISYALQAWKTRFSAKSKHNFVADKELQKKWICTKTTIDQPTSDFHNSRKCNGGKSVSSTISTTFCEKTRSCFEDLRNQRKKNSSQRTANASIQDYVSTRTSA